MPPIDLRSDTVTRPTAGMRRAMADAEVGDDVLDGDPTARRLEAMVAERLGKERALFFPTGTMANQAAIWVLSSPGTELLIDANAHIVEWEMAGVAALAGVQIRHVRTRGSTVQASDLTPYTIVTDPEAAQPSLVSVENTHNTAGGVVTPLAELRAIGDTAHAANLAFHLDGARLWNASAATGTSLADFAACADTVMVSFSKGLGAPVGAALAGSNEVIGRALRARKRFGGGMRQSGIIAAGALYGLEHHLARLPEDHANARTLASHVDGIAGAKVVPPDTNIVMIDLPSARADAIKARAKELGLFVSAWTPTRIRVVTHIDAQAEVIAKAGPILSRVLEEVLN